MRLPCGYAVESCGKLEVIHAHKDTGGFSPDTGAHLGYIEDMMEPVSFPARSKPYGLIVVDWWLVDHCNVLLRVLYLDV